MQIFHIYYFFSFTYQIYISKTSNVSTGEVIKSSQSPFIYQIQDDLMLYYIAIAIIDQDNYVGPISDPLIISNQMKRGFNSNL